MTETQDSTFAPTGEPEQDRDRFLAALLLLTLGDLDAADAMWVEHVSPTYRGMLDGSGGWTFDKERQVYVSRHGRELDGSDLKRIAVTFNTAVDHDMRRAASDMAVGLLTIGEWQRRQAQLVKDLYIADAALAAGGFANLTDDLKQAAIGNPTTPPGLAFSLDRLFQFGQDIGTERNDSEAAVVNRASLYSAAGNGVYENVRRESHKRATDEMGRLTFLYEKSLLGPNENHCYSTDTTDGCVEAAEAGWQPIGTLPLVGTRTCGPNCLCEMTYSLTAGQHEHN